MPRLRFKTELFSPNFAKGTTEDLKIPEPSKADSASIQFISNLAGTFPLLGMLFPAAFNIYSGGAGELYKGDGAREYQPFRLPPDVLINLWRRGLLGAQGLPADFDDLRAQGWSDERIEGYTKASEVLPSPQDAVSFLAHEVFEPEMVEKYNLDGEWDNVDKSIFSTIGMPEDIARLYWRNHWQHPSFTQMTEARRRQLITDEDLYDWFKLVEIPTFWRPLLMDLIWETPTRVDIRRFWDMGTITEERLRELYTAHGYKDQNLEDYILWTKIYTSFPDLIARYKNGWINKEAVIEELEGLGMSSDRARELWETKFKKEAPARLAKERDLTLSQIFKGVKTGKIQRNKASALISGLGYDRQEAELLLEIYAPADEDVKIVKARLLSKADIKAGLKSAEFTEPQVIERLLLLRYTPEDANTLLSIFKAVLWPAENEKERALSRADIIAGVKAGLLSNKEGYNSLLEMGYSPENAEFLLLLKVEDSPFSPQTASEFEGLISQYRKAVNLDFNDTTQAAINAEQQVIRAEADLIAAQNRGALPQETAMYRALLEEAKIHFDQALKEAGD
ncbi:MAG: hypothetical protein CMI54_06375 [Parcubacteria group bacterium]|nr:hypothetical protein [Parcubacteria group bacterium]